MRQNQLTNVRCVMSVSEALLICVLGLRSHAPEKLQEILVWRWRQQTTLPTDRWHYVSAPWPTHGWLLKWHCLWNYSCITAVFIESRIQPLYSESLWDCVHRAMYTQGIYIHNTWLFRKRNENFTGAEKLIYIKKKSSLFITLFLFILFIYFNFFC